MCLDSRTRWIVRKPKVAEDQGRLRTAYRRPYSPAGWLVWHDQRRALFATLLVTVLPVSGWTSLIRPRRRRPTPDQGHKWLTDEEADAMHEESSPSRHPWFEIEPAGWRATSRWPINLEKDAANGITAQRLRRIGEERAEAHRPAASTP